MSEAKEEKSLEQALIDAQKEVAAIRQAHTEAAAEFEKTKERLRRNHSSELERARLRMATNLFEVADNLERVVVAAQSKSELSSFVQGLVLVRDQFFRTLEDFGVLRFNPQGESFDPNRHDAISIVPVTDSKQAGIIIDVAKPGYVAGEQVLRAAEVVVGKLTTEPSNE